MKLIFSVILFFLFFQVVARPPDKDDTKLTKTIDRDFGVPKNGFLELINKYGQVVINTWDKDSVKVKVRITAYGKDDSDAEKMLERVDIDFRKISTYLTIETVLDRKSGFFKELLNNINDYSKTLLSKNKLEIDYEIFMPETMHLDLENKFGDVYVQEMKGKVDIIVTHGNLRAGRFLASARIEAGYGDVKIKEMKEGRLLLKGVKADIGKLGDVDLSSSSSEIIIKEADQLRLDSRSDRRLQINRASHIYGKATFSKLEVQELDKTLDLNMTYGEVRVIQIPFSFSKINIEAKYTEIALDFHPGSYVEADITALEETLSLPSVNNNLDKRYIDEKHKYVQVTGKMGSKNNYPGYLYINSSGGEVSVNLEGLQHSDTK